MRTAIAAFFALLSGAASSEAVTAGWRERAFVEVAEGETAVQSGKVSVVPGGTLYKTGLGTLVVPLSMLDRTYPELNLAVSSGRVRFVDGGTEYSVSRPTVLDEAAFWVDETSVAGDGEGGAAMWNDVRETSAGGGHAYRYAEPVWDEGKPELPLYHVNPAVVEKNGHGGVDFGGFGSGQAMLWKNAAGDTSEVTGIRHLYMVTTVERGWSSPVQSMKCADLRSGSWGSQYGEMFCGSQVNNPAGSDDAVYYFNGVRMDLCKMEPRNLPNGGKGLMLVDIGFYGQKGCQSGNFFSLQGVSGYFGGDTLHEMVAFTKTLSSEEEQAVRRYLMDKYGLAAGEKSAATVALSANAEFEVSASAEQYPDAASARGISRPTIAGTGKIVKTGDGTAVLTMDDMSSVEVRIDGGCVAQRTPVPVALSGGMTVDSDGDGLFGDELTVASGAPADTVIKTGTGMVVANRIPGSIGNIKVVDGTFALRSVCRTGLEPVEHSSVAIPNASFEDNQFDGDVPKSSEPALFYGQTNPNKGSTWPTADYTWVLEALDGGYHDNCWVFYMDGSGAYTNPARHNWASAENPAPDGLWALAIKGHYRAWTRVEIVEKGRYELSFKAVARDGKPNGLSVNLSRGTTAADIVEAGHLGYAFPLGSGYQAYSYATGELEPGTYVLSVADTVLDVYDHTQAVDDFRLVRIPDHDISGMWPLPNGDFENVDPVMGGYYDPWSWVDTSNGNTPKDYFNLNRVHGWTFTGLNDDASVGGGMSRIQPVPTGAYLNHYNSFSRCTGYKGFAGGGVELAFLGGEETASLTFTPPAGTWRLCCDGKRWQGGTQIGGVGSAAGNLQATVAVGGETLSFGTADISNWCVDRCVWPNALTFDGEAEVTLTLKLADAAGVAIVDNFRLVPPAASEIVELVGDPGFETRWGGPWSDHPLDGKTAMWFSYGDPGVMEHFTTDWCEGALGIRLDNTSSMTQSIVIPEDGVYRLSFWSMSRPDGPYAQLATQKNPIQVWLEQNGDRYVIAEARTPTTNFVEHVFLASLKAGSYTLGIQGTATGEDGTRSSLVDRVSLARYAAEAFSPAPEMNEDLVIEVSQGAKLRLDFTGSANVKCVSHGIRNLKGEVSAATHPEFVEGPGRLISRGYDLYITFR